MLFKFKIKISDFEILSWILKPIGLENEAKDA